MILDLASEQEQQVASILSMAGLLALVGSRYLGRFGRPVMLTVTVAYVLGVVGLLVYVMI